MPTSPSQPHGPEEAEKDHQNRGELGKSGVEDAKPPESFLEEERLARIFESFLIRRDEVEAYPSLSSEQISLALQNREEAEKRSHERILLRDRQRHELTLARQQDGSVRRGGVPGTAYAILGARGDMVI